MVKKRVVQKVSILCRNCKKEFKVHDYRKNTAKYCSKKCHPFRQDKIEKEFCCHYCNKFFKRRPGHVNGKRCFCSVSCHSKFNIGKHLGKSKSGIFKLCPVCGKQFYVPKCRITTSKFCSKKCGGFRKGHKPWNYIHGKGKEHRRYGIYWDSHRLKIIERDNSICQTCGKFGNHVDHIIPFRISQDNSFSNLQVLCSSCHGKKTGWEIKYYG